MDSPDLKKTRRQKMSLEDPSRVDRLPPHAMEAEQGVIGCMMLDPVLTIPDCLAVLTEDAFYDLRHREIYSTVTGMFEADIRIDIITVQQRLRDGNKLEAVGGIAYVAGLMDTVPSAHHLPTYIEILRDKHSARRMIAACTSAIGRIYEANGAIAEILSDVERDVMQASRDRITQTTPSVNELVHQAIQTIEDYHHRQGAVTGLGTGFVDFDKLTSGLQAGEMSVIAGRPSMGKSSLAMNIVEHVALDLGLPVGVFSLEMTAHSLILRMMCSRARVNMRNMREGFMADRDFPKLTTAAAKIAHAPIFIDDASGLSISQLRARARRMHQQHGIKLFVVDYLQLLMGTNHRRESRQQDVSEMSLGMKSMAKDLDVPVMVISQLNRDVEKDRTRKPRLSDLRESGSIEQDADLVGLLYRASERDTRRAAGGDEEDDGNNECVPMNLLIAKQRSGPAQVDVHLTFIRTFTRFESAAKVSSEDYVSTPNLPYHDS
jgi:replicative DNA helicase